MAPRKDLASEDYFAHYTVLQKYKHDLLNYYLGGWFGKIAGQGKEVAYCETHAGAGVHKTGHSGSPIVALEKLLGHRLRRQILRKSSFVFLLMEVNTEYVARLRSQLAKFPLPPEVRVKIENEDFKKVLGMVLDEVDRKGGALAPAFTFVDPFGYDIPLALIHRLLRQPSSEVMVTFMAQAVARAMGDATKVDSLNSLYGSDTWVPLSLQEDFEARKRGAIDLYRKTVNARWCTALRLKGQTDYALMHFTNHPDGRDLMKKAIWAIERGGSYQVFGTDNPDQLTLIEREPDLGPFVRQLRKAFANRTVTYPELVAWVRETDYRDVHLNTILAQGKREGWIETSHKGKFGFSTRAPIHVSGT
jgi:three-Cys-motif partner protein